MLKGTAARFRGALRLIARFGGATQGNVAMIFAFVVPALILMIVGGIDLHRASTVRQNLQDALDAATLAAARSEFVLQDDLTRVGLAALKANLQPYDGVTLDEDQVSFVISDGVIVANATVNVNALVANVVLPPYGQLLDDTLPVSSHAEVHRSTTDIEVSLVLDITGSMGEGTRMADLQVAATDLVDLVVQTNQDINSTRMALVPYSMGVNAEDYLNQARGAAVGARTINGAGWMVADTQKSITGVNKANPGVFTASSHGYDTGHFVWISGVTDKDSGSDLAGWLNNKPYRVKKINNNTFSLERWSNGNWVNVSTSGYQSYNNSGIARRCIVSTCEVVVTTSTNHALNTNDDVRILGVRGMTQINTHDDVYRTRDSDPALSRRVTKQTNTTFSLNGVVGPNVSNYTSGGTVQCLEYGCSNFLFTNNDGNLRVYEATKCVSERTGDEAYTDAAPSDSRVSFIYTGTAVVSQGGCMSTKFTPLTTDRALLRDAIEDYTPEGGTAGQIGVGWGWYMVSPTFGSIFPHASRPAAYGTDDLLKVVIIMTDGEFNAVYYDGVRARDSGAGGGTDERWINHDSSNGSPFLQSVAMCDAMKARGIIIYTVGFDITSTGNNTAAVDSAREVMEECATDEKHVFLPETGSALRASFGAIGRSISQLRISK